MAGGERQLGGGDGVAEGTSVPRVALVTGASRLLGGFLVTRLAQNPDIERVIAVDSLIPSKDMLRRMGRAEFVRADIRNPLVGKVVRQAEVDTVVHTAMLTRVPRGSSRAAMKDANVIGAMQLFAVCQKSPSVRRVVLKSTSAVYGSTSKDPAKFTEEMSARRRPAGAYARDSIEVEGYARGLARRRPDLALSILRLAPIVGPRLNGTIGRYVTTPVVPTVAGRDARFQLLHEHDALGALERAALTGPAGTFNIAGDGVVMLSQAIRRLGRIAMPIPSALFHGAGRSAMGPIMRSYTQEQPEYFQFGCGLDTTRMRTELGFEPSWTTAEALADLARAARAAPLPTDGLVDRVERVLLDVVAPRGWAKGDA
ncbi:NAD-dependent epimerase/dehydratase family protein [Rhodococcus rhodnii]|nr:NAD-dependent epimerase/dehydratase family protein [Rhodococcus rhodnii]TXG92906.1 NAD-dependent epimerase/dehydratase family protein [Rhodococcus rhodnii]